jgi:hypothetical protein
VQPFCNGSTTSEDLNTVLKPSYDGFETYIKGGLVSSSI